MIARFINYDAETIGLLLGPIDWNTKPTVELSLPTDTDKNMVSQYESRRTFAESARYNFKFRAALADSSESTELRIFMTALKGETLAVPLWTDAVPLSAAVAVGAINIPVDDQPVRYGAEWIILADDLSQWEIVVVNSVSSDLIQINVGTQFAWAADTMMYPLLFGKFVDGERPKPEALTDEQLLVDLHIQENSPFARRLNPFAGAIPTVGASIPAFAAVPLFNVLPDFQKPADSTLDNVLYAPIGFLRQDQQRVYGQPNQRTLEHDFYQASRADIAAIERLFIDRRGNTRPFMVPTFRGDLRLAADVAIGDAQLTVEPNEFTDDTGRDVQNGDPYAVLVEFMPDGSVVIDPRKIDVINSTTLGLVGPAASIAHSMDRTIVSHLPYVRFTDPKLTWSYLTDACATTKGAFTELASEYVTRPADLPEPFYLFVFTHELPTPQIYRFTSYEQSITIASGPWAGTYTPAPFAFKSVKTGLALDQEKLELASFPFPGNPIEMFFPFALDGIMSIDVGEGDARDWTTAIVSRFSGEVWEADLDCNATCLAFGHFFERKFPRFLLQVSDNYTEFTPPTMLNAATYKITGTIAAMNTANRTVDITSAPAAAKPADWYPSGWFETGAGANFERRSITDQAAISGGVRLTIDRPLLKAVNGQSIDTYPGYDGSIETCDSKFNNRINHGGHRYVPDTNTLVKLVKTQQVTGGKK